MIVQPPGGWFKFVAMLIQIILGIIGQENKQGAGTGPLKKKEVMRLAEVQAQNLALVTGGSSCSMEQIMEDISEVIDRVVSLLNCLGLFK